MAVALPVAIATAIVVLVMSLLVAAVQRAEDAEGHGAGSEGTSLDVDAPTDAARAYTIGLVAILGVAAAAGVGWVAARRASRPLTHALELQQRFVADAGHELRTPAAIVHTRAQLLLARAAPDDPSRAGLQQLVKDSRVLGDVIGDLLLATRLDRGTLSTEVLSTGALATDVVGAYEVIAADRSVRLRCEVPAAAPAVTGHPVALRRALSGIVDNAISHSPSDGLVTVAVVDDGHGMVGWQVTDEGPGLPPGREQLLERFRRSSDDGDEHRFGLGLWLAAQTMTACGGRIELGDAPTGGARIALWLPATRALPDDAPAADLG